MSIALHGVGVSGGIAIGRVHIIERDQMDIPEYRISQAQVPTETERLFNAVTSARQQLRAIRDHIPAGTSADIIGFIDTPLLMLDDAALLQEPERLIRKHHYNA